MKLDLHPHRWSHTFSAGLVLFVSIFWHRVFWLGLVMAGIALVAWLWKPNKTS